MIFGFVVLNFLTSKDTVEAVQSIQKLKCKQEDSVKIFIVDNGSPLNVHEQLSNSLKDELNILIIRNNLNEGFAKGNNIGIKAAIHAKCNFITCLNNDITIASDNYLTELVKIFKSNNDIAVIGPKIINNNGMNQNPFRKNPITQDEIIYFNKIYLSLFGWMRFWFQRYWITELFALFQKKQEKSPTSDKIEPASGNYYALHGSILTFTPHFFEQFNGFDPGTFLYGEEIILAEMVQQKGMKCFYTNQITAYHAEDVSTDIYLKNRSKTRFYLKHEYDSFRHLTRNYFSN